MEQNKYYKTNDPLQIVTFKIGEEEFGFNLLKVLEINRNMRINKTSNAPMIVAGIAEIHGQMIPVIDLRVKLNLPKTEFSNETRVIVVELNKTVALIVDEVSELLRIPLNLTGARPASALRLYSKYIIATGKLLKGLLMLMDIDKILDQDDFTPPETV